MIICTICRFQAELDDVAVPGTAERGICLRCFARTTGSEKRMPRTLRRELGALLAALESQAA
ncbi:MAG: hypothetical protein C4290_05425 [Chloroflexota bacterium]